MNKNYSALRRLLSVWYLFLGWLLAVIIVFGLIYGLRTAYRANEQISVFIAAESVENERLEALLNENRPLYLANIKLSYCTSLRNETIYNVNWLQATTLATDIYVLPESKISAQACNAYFLPITDEFIKNNFIKTDRLIFDGNIYGLKINQNKDNGLISFSDENYYVCFGRHCGHLGLGSANDGAIEIANWLLNGMGEEYA